MLDDCIRYKININNPLTRMKNIGIIFIAIMMLSSFSNREDQLLKTSLKITVRNELGNIEPGVEVKLFASDADYRKETNPVQEAAYTDKKGQVKFKELKSKVYYILAKKGDKSNVGAGVSTDKLEEGKLNKVTIIIE